MRAFRLNRAARQAQRTEISRKDAKHANSAEDSFLLILILILLSALA